MIKYFVWFLPLIFIFHDMEEIIGMSTFLKKNKDLLEEKYPMIIKQYKDFSTEGFAFAVYEELIICMILSALVFFTDIKVFYFVWLGVFIAFIFHLVVHIIQSLILRKYVPAIVTSILCLPVSIFVIKISLDPINSGFNYIWMILGFIMVFVNLILIQRAIGWFTKKMGINPVI